MTTVVLAALAGTGLACWLGLANTLAETRAWLTSRAPRSRPTRALRQLFTPTFISPLLAVGCYVARVGTLRGITPVTILATMTLAWLVTLAALHLAQAGR